jgi:hypothetical protein
MASELLEVLQRTHLKILYIPITEYRFWYLYTTVKPLSKDSLTSDESETLKLRNILKCKEFNNEITNLGSLQLNIKWEKMLNQETLNRGSTVTFITPEASFLNYQPLFKLALCLQSHYIRNFPLNFPQLPLISCTKYINLANYFHYGLFNLSSFCMFGKGWKKPFQEVDFLLQW